MLWFQMNGPLIGSIQVSTRNHVGTDKTVTLLLAARAQKHQMSCEKKHGPAGTRTRNPRRPCEHPYDLALQPQGRPVSEIKDHRQFYDLFRTTTDKSSLRKNETFVHYDSPVLPAGVCRWANSEYAVSRSAEGRGRPIDCIYFQSKKISNDQELIQSDPISCPQNQKGNN